MTSSFKQIGTDAEPKTRKDPEPECSLCRDSLWIMRFDKIARCPVCDPDAEKRKREALGKFSRVPRHLLQSCKIGNYRIDKTMGSLIEKETLMIAKDVARDFADCKVPFDWLWFDGPTGTGKTHLAVATINRIIWRGNEACIFVVVPEMLDEWRASYDPKSSESFEELFREVRDVHVLVLDDLSLHGLTDWATDKLFTLMNYRYSRRLRTVITTQDLSTSEDQHKGQHKSYWSIRWAALMSRMLDGGVVRRCWMVSPDYRRMR